MIGYKHGMGCQHWRLLKGDDYQRDVTRMRVAELLDAHAKGIEGPLALSCEAPVEGWDDIVEYGATIGRLTATHHQVKLQNTNFKAGEKNATFEELFKHAAKILADADPYEGVKIPPEDRYFRFVLPTDNIKVGKTLGIDQLRMLLEECAGNAADAIARAGSTPSRTRGCKTFALSPTPSWRKCGLRMAPPTSTSASRSPMGPRRTALGR